VPLRAAAQPGLLTIGYLSSRSAAAETPLRTGFLEGLAQRGLVVGRNVAVEYGPSNTGAYHLKGIYTGGSSRAKSRLTCRFSSRPPSSWW
jgi:hypothetical protein